MALARRTKSAGLLARLRNPRHPEDATIEGRLGLLTTLAEGNEREHDWIHRNLQWGPTEPAEAGGGGGSAQQVIRPVPICTIVAEMDQIKPPVSIVAFPIWNRNPVRHLEGVPEDAVVRRITGTVYVEPYSGGVPQVFLVDCRPKAQPLYVPGGSLLGFDVGFGRYGDGVDPMSERKKFRIDVFVFQEEAGAAELTAIVPDGSAAFMSSRTVLSDALLSAYEAKDSGLRFKCNLTFSG